MSDWTDWDRCPPGPALRNTDPEVASVIARETDR